MNEEQKARLAKAYDDFCGVMKGDDWVNTYGEWLLALVKELAEENARLRAEASTSKARLDGTTQAIPVLIADERNRAIRAEQQLAAVTAERDGYKGQLEYSRHNDPAVTELQRVEAERDELRREVERLKQEASESLAARLFNDALLRERAEKVEAERDALRAMLVDVTDASRRMLTIVDGHTFRSAEEATIGTPARRLSDCLKEARRELARLKGEKGGG